MVMKVIPWRDRVLDHSIPLPRYADQASDWNHCAVGERQSVLQARHHFEVTQPEEPLYPSRLHSLGVDFAKMVAYGYRDEALEILDELDAMCEGVLV